MTRPAQLVFDLSTRPALGREDFLISPSNSAALGFIERWPDWPGAKLAIAGPAGAGKTHLTHVWAARSGARIISLADLADLRTWPSHLAVEDVDRIDQSPDQEGVERALFHAHNVILEGGGSLLFTGRTAPAHWPIGLPDLRSRLSSITLVPLEDPDDTLLSGVLVKLFADRQLRVAPDLVSYLVSRMERSIAAAGTMVDRLDRAGLSRGQNVTRALATKVLRDI